MRKLLVVSAATLSIAVGTAMAAGVTQSAPGVAGDVATTNTNMVIAQAQPVTTAPNFTVTAPAPRINDPWHISTWRFHAGPSQYAPTTPTWGLSGGQGPTAGVPPPK